MVPLQLLSHNLWIMPKDLNSPVLQIISILRPITVVKSLDHNQHRCGGLRKHQRWLASWMSILSIPSQIPQCPLQEKVIPKWPQTVQWSPALLPESAGAPSPGTALRWQLHCLIQGTVFIQETFLPSQTPPRLQNKPAEQPGQCQQALPVNTGTSWTLVHNSRCVF